MTTTSVDDAIILPQSQGTGLSGEESVIDAAINGVLNRYVGSEYVDTSYSTGLAFQNHNASSDTVEVGPGIVFVQDNSTSTGGQRSSEGNPQAESSTTSGYDTELPEGHTYAVLFPTAQQISVTGSTLNEVYVDIDDVTANNSVNLEHDGSTNASPGSTSLKIGETNPDDASADTRANDDASPTYNSLTVNGTTDTDALNAKEADISNETFISATGPDDSSANTAGTFVNMLDGSGQKDIRNEFSSGQFTPDKTRFYTINFTIDLDSVNSGDTIDIRLQDVTNNVTMTKRIRITSTGSFPGDTRMIVEKLTAGDSYELQITDKDSSFERGGCRATITKELIQ